MDMDTTSNRSLAIGECQDLLKARGWTVTKERLEGDDGWTLDLTGPGRTLTVKDRSALAAWRKAVEMTE
jgi:hypothetical protein